MYGLTLSISKKPKRRTYTIYTVSIERIKGKKVRRIKKMRKRKVYTTTIMAFLMIATLLATVFVASAALGITLNPTSGSQMTPSKSRVQISRLQVLWA